MKGLSHLQVTQFLDRPITHYSVQDNNTTEPDKRLPLGYYMKLDARVKKLARENAELGHKQYS
jgi:hypothetical protein